MKRKGCVLVLLLVMIGLPQRTSAQSTRQKLFEVEESVIYGISWGRDSRWLVVTTDADKFISYDLETHMLYRESPAIPEQLLTAEEYAYLHIAEDNFANISISPNGRYVLYRSSDPIPTPLTPDEQLDFEVYQPKPIYLADRSTRQYGMWTRASSFIGATWSPDSSGALVWLGFYENSGFAGYLTNFQNDIRQFRVVDVREATIQDKEYHFDWENYYDFYAISRDGRKLLVMGHDNDTEAPSLIAFDVGAPSQHRVVVDNAGHIYYDRDRVATNLLIGGAGFGADVDRYVWILSNRGLLLHDMQNSTTRLVDASIVAADVDLCCGNRGAFSPDGKGLAYAVYDEASQQVAIYLVDLEQFMQ